MAVQIQAHSFPLHPSVKDRLHPEYVAFYNKHLLNLPPAHCLPLSVSRAGGNAIACHSDPLPVGRVQDICIPQRARQETNGPDIPIRCFTPQGTPPSSGWPLVLYYHGGGWVFGDLSTENNVSNLTSCSPGPVRQAYLLSGLPFDLYGLTGVISDRLAPEAPWPAAIHDSWETLLWATSTGKDTLNLDLIKIAIGGASSGGNIAAVIVQNAVVQQCALIRSQFLIVPVTDNTATPCSKNPTWKMFEHTAALSAKKMLWYRNHYLPDPATWSHREASPLLAPNAIFRQLPRANIIVGELDVLRHEGEEYARKLEANGISADLTVMKGMPHPFLAMDAVLEAGKRAISITCDGLIQAFSS